MYLDKDWKLYYFDEGCYNEKDLLQVHFDDSNWLSADVPGDVHSILLKHKVIEDPYYSANDAKCQWIENKVWWYRNVFEYTDLPKEGEKIELTFEGLDTCASIYLNGELIGYSSNMFVPMTLDVSKKLYKGTNVLAVKFHPLSEIVKDKSIQGMWCIYSKERVWVRKCAMNFGWDWGPRLVTVGIWKPVQLQKRKLARFESVFIKAKHIDFEKQFAIIEAQINIDNFTKATGLSASIEIVSSNHTYNARTPIDSDHFHIAIPIEDASFWWPFDLGDPYLYQITVKLIHNNDVVDRYSTEYGIREIKVKLSDELHTPRFTFTVNGIDIFARGANWIPAHNFIGAIEDHTYGKLLQLARDANMNMLRVWGGGIYEKDAFYRECNRLGILIWQDFMFACSEYPDFDADFMQNVRNEVESAVKSLRNHPCIALWVGNNENQGIHHEQKLGRTLYGDKIYNELMPELLSTLDDTRMYWPGSPYGGENPNCQELGDRHNWDIWHGGVPSYKKYAEDKTLFSSEFGMHAAPVKYTLERNVPEGKLVLGSFELDYRNKDLNPDKVNILMGGHTGLPRNIDEYVDFSMLLQAEGLKYAVEHYRRRFPECAGALIWQLNDCWPGQSWSMIDYYLYPKASYYLARKYFSPILVSFKEESEHIFSIWVTNNSTKNYTDTLIFGVKSFVGMEIHEETIDVNVQAGSSQKIKTVNVGGLHSPDVVVFQKRWLYAYLKPSDPKVYGNEYFFKEFKDCRFPECRLKTTFSPVEKGLKLTVSTDNFARFVKIEYKIDGTLLSDNYFNIYPGEEKEVIITHDTVELSPKMFTVTAINSEK